MRLKKAQVSTSLFLSQKKNPWEKERDYGKTFRKKENRMELLGKKKILGKKKAQVSTEYLVIIGFVLIVLVPVTIIYIRYTGSTQDVVGGAKTSYLASEIVKAANEVYAYGQDSQKKIKLNFPDGIDKVEFQGKEIVFTFKDSKGRTSEIVEVADVTFRNTRVPVTPGQKDLIIRSLGVSVAVTVACNNNEQKAGDSDTCLALCTPQKSPCTLKCVNKAWTCV